MSVIIRKVRLEDYESLIKIYHEVDELHLNSHPELFKRSERNSREIEYINTLIHDENKGLFVAEKDSEIIGFAECLIINSPIFPVLVERRWTQLDTIAVKKEYRNMKVGALLLNQVKAWSIEKNIKRIELNVYTFNFDTINFYEKNRFEELSKKMYLNL